MAVYVDDALIPFGRMKMCHMMADSLEELHAMAYKIGLKRSWFQNNLQHPHYDISLSKKILAVKNGAIQISQREMVVWNQAVRRKNE